MTASTAAWMSEYAHSASSAVFFACSAAGRPAIRWAESGLHTTRWFGAGYGRYAGTLPAPEGKCAVRSSCALAAGAASVARPPTTRAGHEQGEQTAG